jgi:tryptophan 7-halogenase
MENRFKVVIVGGGTAGYMSAALLARLGGPTLDLTLVESEEIATIGVGEATIPAIKQFNNILGIDEDEFIRATQGTFKLGIKFKDWTRLGHEYIHGFGRIGRDWEFLRLHQYWLHQHLKGQASDFSAYSINTMAPNANKFMRPNLELKESPLSEIAYAFHFDAGLYAKYLRHYSETKGLKRIEGKVSKVHQNPETGFINSIELEGGLDIKGDLFIDCTGFKGLLIEETLKTGYENWGKWLKADRAIAVPCESKGEFAPYTLSTALESGWQWKIPLQHRTGNGHVYSSQYIDDDKAEEILLSNLEGAPRANPLRLKFTLGRRKQLWNKNVVAIGLSGGFLEPLESTGLYMIQSAAIRLIRLFPDKGFNQANIDEFNRQASFEFERIRDFIILHYKATERNDSQFWRDISALEIPDTLQNKIDLFAANGRIFRENEEMFAEESWIQVFLGQGIIPKNHDPLVNIKSEDEIKNYLANVEKVIEKCVNVMPSQKEFIEKFCKAPNI